MTSAAALFYPRRFTTEGGMMVGAGHVDHVEGTSAFLGSVRPGEVRALIVDAIGDGLALLRAHAGGTGHRTVVHCWHELPDVHTVIDETVGALARAASDLWPDWYPGSPRRFVTGERTELGALNDSAVQAVLGWKPGVNGGWLRAAVGRRATGSVPLLPTFPAGLQARQLSMAIGDGPIVAMGLDLLPSNEIDRQPHSLRRSRLRAFASAATWLANETAARVVTVLTPELARDPSLDGVTYGAYRLEPEGPPPREEHTGEAMTTVWPVLGRPHPSSSGECLLAERLAADVELRGLFAFNQRISTVRDSSHLVDLVWIEGGVVVEVDGWGHLMPRNYRGDRHRDYELLISGYLVLRLPHEQILDDPAIALEKIRDVVHFRRRERAAPGSLAAHGGT